MLVLQKNYSVIPIKIRGIEDLAINKVFARKARTVISVGPIISNQEARKISSDPQVIASELMRKVYELE